MTSLRPATESRRVRQRRSGGEIRRKIGVSHMMAYIRALCQTPIREIRRKYTCPRSIILLVTCLMVTALSAEARDERVIPSSATAFCAAPNYLAYVSVNPSNFKPELNLLFYGQEGFLGPLKTVLSPKKTFPAQLLVCDQSALKLISGSYVSHFSVPWHQPPRFERTENDRSMMSKEYRREDWLDISALWENKTVELSSDDTQHDYYLFITSTGSWVTQTSRGKPHSEIANIVLSKHAPWWPPADVEEAPYQGTLGKTAGE